MLNFEFLSMAWQSLLANKARTTLSMLGIIIGVSTVIAVVAIGAGAKQQIEEQFKNLSSTSLMVSPPRRANTNKLSNQDVDTVMAQAQYINEGTASLSGSVNISYAKETASAQAFGITSNFFDISNLSILEGQDFTEYQNLNREKVVILGFGVATTLFGEGFEQEALGNSLKIGSRQYEIIGILNENGASSFGTSYDDSIYAPYNTAEKIILGKGAQLRIVFLANDIDALPIAEEEIKTILRSAHKLKDSQDDDFQIRDPGSIVSSATESSDTLSFLLVSIATIVLIVSGIGIMNVMFVTVAERTKEIGIMKAIGAKQKDILTQFLLESIILSLAGGVIGIALGLSVIPLLDKYGAAATVYGPVLGFTFSALVGIFFGFYPALKASQMDPVDALRND